jgi:hypothetical protein
MYIHIYMNTHTHTLSLSLSLSLTHSHTQVGDIGTWVPSHKVDLVTVCESIYFCHDPQAALSHMVSKCLKPGGVLALTVDCYQGNAVSQRWAKDLGVPMHCKSEEEWKHMLEQAGLTHVKLWRSKRNWFPRTHSLRKGTLVLTGCKSTRAREHEADAPLCADPGSAHTPPPALSRGSAANESKLKRSSSVTSSAHRSHHPHIFNGSTVVLKSNSAR